MPHEDLPFNDAPDAISIQKLRREIEDHNRRYYQEAAPTISDLEYDRLLRQLHDLEQEYPDLASADSPTQRVGERLQDGFQPVRHRVPMLSLDNTYSREELNEAFARLERLLPSGRGLAYVVEPKVDGVAISLLYEKGKLRHAATRGDGAQGDDVTRNIETIRSIPRRLEGDSVPDVLEIRGEIYLPKTRFSALNEQRQAEGEAAFANPRNAAAGSLKQLDPAIVATRGLESVFYATGMRDGVAWATQYEMLSALRTWGFPVHSPETVALAQSREEVFAAIDRLDAFRHDLPFEVDGAVIKLNAFSLQSSAGMTSKSPRWAFAFKYQPEQAETRLKAITIQVGRTGVLTPVAELEPVFVSGSTVARATLHNEEEIARKDIRAGDWVVVEKAGEVIPAVVEVRKERRTGEEVPFLMPTECPSCHGPASREPGQVAVRCRNPACPAQFQRRLEHFASRGAMDIEGLGEVMVRQLIEADLVHDLAGIYRLNADELAKLPRTGEKSITNLLQGIEASKERPLWRLLFGLGILHVGVTSARALAAHFQTLAPLMAADVEALMEIPDVGPVVAPSIVEAFKNPALRQTIEALREQGVNLGERDEVAEMGPKTTLLEGTWVITGTLSESRDVFAARIRENGGKITSAVSKKTTYLLAGEEAGSKLDKAQKLGVTVLDEAAFRAKLAGHPAPVGDVAPSADAPPSTAFTGELFPGEG